MKLLLCGCFLISILQGFQFLNSNSTNSNNSTKSTKITNSTYSIKSTKSTSSANSTIAHRSSKVVYPVAVIVNSQEPLKNYGPFINLYNKENHILEAVGHNYYIFSREKNFSSFIGEKFNITINLFLQGSVKNETFQIFVGVNISEANKLKGEIKILKKIKDTFSGVNQSQFEETFTGKYISPNVFGVVIAITTFQILGRYQSTFRNPKLVSHCSTSFSAYSLSDENGKFPKLEKKEGELVQFDNNRATKIITKVTSPLQISDYSYDNIDDIKDLVQILTKEIRNTSEEIKASDDNLKKLEDQGEIKNETKVFFPNITSEMRTSTVEIKETLEETKDETKDLVQDITSEMRTSTEEIKETQEQKTTKEKRNLSQEVKENKLKDPGEDAPDPGFNGFDDNTVNNLANIPVPKNEVKSTSKSPKKKNNTSGHGGASDATGNASKNPRTCDFSIILSTFVLFSFLTYKQRKQVLNLTVFKIMI